MIVADESAITRADPRARPDAGVEIGTVALKENGTPRSPASTVTGGLGPSLGRAVVGEIGNHHGDRRCVSRAALLEKRLSQPTAAWITGSRRQAGENCAIATAILG